MQECLRSEEHFEEDKYRKSQQNSELMWDSKSVKPSQEVQKIRRGPSEWGVIPEREGILQATAGIWGRGLGFWLAVRHQRGMNRLWTGTGCSPLASALGYADLIERWGKWK